MNPLDRPARALDALWERLDARGVGARIAFFLFFFATFNAAFLQPNIILIVGERSKLFPALCCAVALLGACVLIRGAWRKLWSLEGLISLTLLVLALLSGSLSPHSDVALWRSLTVMASSLGGFWCARILLNTPSRRLTFAWYEFVLLAGVLTLCMVTYVLKGDVFQFLDDNQHPLVSRIVLMSFALLVMVFRKRRWLRNTGIFFLGLSFLVYSLSSLRSAMFMPLVIGGALFVVGIVRVRNLAIFILPLIIIICATFYSISLIESKLPGDYYRLESYVFSWEVATDRPWLGLGLMAPRDAYLDDYEMFFGSMSKENFVQTVKYLSSENIFLTFMVGLGMPFTFIYALSVMALYVLLVRRRRRANRRMALPFPALLFPITAGLLHFLISDGLLQPQVSWFFHLLLGMIPVRDAMWCETEPCRSVSVGGQA